MTVVDLPSYGDHCFDTPDLNSFFGVWSRTCLSSLALGIGFFGIFELGNTFAEPFGDDECDLGPLMMKMGVGLEEDLNHIFEQPIPHSRLRRISTFSKKADSWEAGRGDEGSAGSGGTPPRAVA